MKLALADVNLELLTKEGQAIAEDILAGDHTSILLEKVDVSKVEQMEAFKEKVLDTYGEIKYVIVRILIVVQVKQSGDADHRRGSADADNRHQT